MLSPDTLICPYERSAIANDPANDADDGLATTGPDSARRWFASSAGAECGFCGQCGAPLFLRHKCEGDGKVAPGAIDMPTGPEGTGLNTTGHIYTGFKRDDDQIAGGLPQAPHEE